jgi:hypothetical protein
MTDFHSLVGVSYTRGIWHWEQTFLRRTHWQLNGTHRITHDDALIWWGRPVRGTGAHAAIGPSHSSGFASWGGLATAAADYSQLLRCSAAGAFL